MENLRLYSFVTFYLAKGIHAGIQTGHAAVDLTRKYMPNKGESEEHVAMVAQWADIDKTFIVLNGGMHFEMQQVLDTVRDSGYPFAVFHESQEALAGIMTSVVVVLPESIYDMRRVPNQYFQRGYHYERKWTDENGFFQTETVNPGNSLFEFIDMLKSKRMAD
jgi:hypothetical protein